MLQYVACFPVEWFIKYFLYLTLPTHGLSTLGGYFAVSVIV